MKAKTDEINFVKDGSLDRPAWTSEERTGGLQAFRHKHTIFKGKFALLKDYYVAGG